MTETEHYKALKKALIAQKRELSRSQAARDKFIDELGIRHLLPDLIVYFNSISAKKRTASRKKIS
jgi:hypothetical protein